MDFVLNRKGGVPLHDQLLTQLELKILGGAIAPGDRLEVRIQGLAPLVNVVK